MDRDEQLYNSILEEAKLSHERLGAFTDSTQKVVATMLTLTTLASGFLFSQANGTDPAALQKLPFELLFLSLFISLTVAQGTHYNSLAFYYMERKQTCGRRLKNLVKIDGNPFDGLSALRNSEMWGTFFWSSLIYYACEGGIGTCLAGSAIWVRNNHGGLLSISFTLPAAVVSVISVATLITTGRFFWVANKQLRNAQTPEIQVVYTVPGKRLLHLLPAELEINPPTSETFG